MIKQNPTHFPELDIVLQQFVEQVLSILGDNVIGVYLQGSHAYGVTLWGAPVVELIDEVSSDVLKAELRALMVNWGRELLAHPERFSGMWYQSFAVVSYCRMLHTLATGRVYSKVAGVKWANVNLAPQWHDFINRAQANRKDQFLGIYDLNHPEDFARTPGFIRYALGVAGLQ